MRTRQGETICLGEWIRLASASVPPAGGVWGGMRAGFGLGVFGNSVALKKELENDIIVLQVIKYIISYSIHYNLLCPQ